MASQALMCDKNAFPRPCPSAAPFTKPAMSTTFKYAGTLLKIQFRTFVHHFQHTKRSNIYLTWLVCDIQRDNQIENLVLVRDVLGTENKRRRKFSVNIFHHFYTANCRSREKKYLFSLGSMVQKGKFSAGAALFVSTLKNVDLPTFGTPTMPTRKFVPTRPINGFFSGSSTFFGAICENCEFFCSQSQIHNLIDFIIAPSIVFLAIRTLMQCAFDLITKSSNELFPQNAVTFFLRQQLVSFSEDCSRQMDKMLTWFACRTNTLQKRAPLKISKQILTFFWHFFVPRWWKSFYVFSFDDAKRACKQTNNKSFLIALRFCIFLFYLQISLVKCNSLSAFMFLDKHKLNWNGQRHL